MNRLIGVIESFRGNGAMIASENILFWVLIVVLVGSVLLLLAAQSRSNAGEHGGQDKESIEGQITARYGTMGHSLKEYIEFRNNLAGKVGSTTPIVWSSANAEQLERIVATDAFVERAKAILRRQAIDCLFYARVSLISCTLIAVVFIMWMLFLPSQVKLVTVGGKVTNMAWFYLIVRASGVVALFFFGIVITSGLARKFFAEWSTLMSRRHALRFGRLAVFLLGDQLKVADLTQLFGWNAVIPTAFDSKDANALNSSYRDITQNSLQTLIDALINKNVSESTKSSGAKDSD